LWVVLRKTFGWNKPSDYISNSQFVKETGIKKYHVWRTQKRLIWRNIITKRGNNKLSFNTNYGEWKELPIGATITKQGIKVANSGNKVANRGGYKEHSPNNNKQRIISFSSNKELFDELLVAYKEEKSIDYKPYFWGRPMWRDENGKWFVIHGVDDFREFGGSIEQIEFRRK